MNTIYLWRAGGWSFLLAAWLAWVPRAAAATFTVTTTADFEPGSLRQAIADANASPGLDTIRFNIPGAGVKVIALDDDALPEITDPVILDGATQPGYAGLPRIELRPPRSERGLWLKAGSCTVRAMAFTAGLEGVRITGAGGNTITGCHFGVDAEGLASVLQPDTGIAIERSPNNVIGGRDTGARNLFGSGGITISGTTATGNRVEGNFFGLDRAGTRSLDGNLTGVAITEAPGNIIGGTAPGTRNYFAARGTGIQITGAGATNNTVQGNSIGALGIDGNAVANGPVNGIGIADAPNNLVGGNSAAARNLIAGCRFGAGVKITGASATGNRVQGNFLGTDASGSRAVANFTGVEISGGASGNLVGGAGAGEGNLISGNKVRGVLLSQASANRVQGNLIGTDVAGKAAIPNGQPDGYGYGNGVDIGANVGADFGLPTAGNLIGGVNPGEGNVISGNANVGINLFGLLTASNLIQGNFIGSIAGGGGPLGNGAAGIFPDYAGAGIAMSTAKDIIIGGPPGSGAGNVIGWNGRGGPNDGGVFVYFATNILVQGNTILSNAGSGVSFKGPTQVLANLIYGNTGLTIDRGADGPTPNTPGSPFNAPVLTDAVQGSAIISGKIERGLPNCEYLVEITVRYQPVNNEQVLGTLKVTTDTQGNASFSELFPGQFQLGDKFESTATPSAKCLPFPETSERSNPIALRPGTTTPCEDCISFATDFVEICASATNTPIVVRRTTKNCPGAEGVSPLLYDDDFTPADPAVVKLARNDYDLIPFVGFSATSPPESIATLTLKPKPAWKYPRVLRLKLAASDPFKLCADSLDTMTVVIKDCPPPCIQAATAYVSVDEKAGVAVVTLRRSGDTSKPSSAAYKTATPDLPGVEAQPGADYDPVAGRAEFAVGETEKQIRIPIKDDDEVETPEVFDLQLSDPSGAVLCGDPTVRVAIISDDVRPGTRPPVREHFDCISLESVGTVCVQDGLVTIHVIRRASSATVSPAKIRARTEPAPKEDLSPYVEAAVSGEDFEPLDQDVTFPGSSTSETEVTSVMLRLTGKPVEKGKYKRLQLRLSQPDGPGPCTTGVVAIDLVDCSDPPPKPQILFRWGTETDPAGAGVVVDWDGPGIPGHSPRPEGPFIPVRPKDKPIVTPPDELRKDGPQGFIRIGRIPGKREKDPIQRRPPVPDLTVDFGDAPQSYEQLPLPIGGGFFIPLDFPAGHVIDRNFTLGQLIDGEIMNQPSPKADGDDLNLLPDEDGVKWNGPLVAGVLATVTVTASQPGFLDLWIDYDSDGSFLNPFPKTPAFPDNYVNRAILVNGTNWDGGSYPLAAGANVIRFRVPNDVFSGLTYARFRFTKKGFPTPLFIAPDGEVEDYQVPLYDLLTDFGDAPEDAVNHYPTTLSNDGAFHLAVLNDFYLGRSIDFETDGKPDDFAQGDDLDIGPAIPRVNNGQDEDGLLSLSNLSPGKTATLTVLATVRSLQEGKLDAWIDFYRQGDWDDPDAQILKGAKVIEGTNTFTFKVPPSAVKGSTYMRLRLSKDGNLTPRGPALGGEVEDYQVLIVP